MFSKKQLEKLQKLLDAEQFAQLKEFDELPATIVFVNGAIGLHSLKDQSKEFLQGALQQIIRIYSHMAQICFNTRNIINALVLQIINRDQEYLAEAKSEVQQVMYPLMLGKFTEYQNQIHALMFEYNQLRASDPNYDPNDLMDIDEVDMLITHPLSVPDSVTYILDFTGYSVNDWEYLFTQEQIQTLSLFATMPQEVRSFVEMVQASVSSQQYDKAAFCNSIEAIAKKLSDACSDTFKVFETILELKRSLKRTCIQRLKQGLIPYMRERSQDEYAKYHHVRETITTRNQQLSSVSNSLPIISEATGDFAFDGDDFLEGGRTTPNPLTPV